MMNRRESGVTMIEVMLAVIVVGLVLTAGITALGVSVEVKAHHTKTADVTSTLAKNIHALALGLSRDPGDGNPASNGTGVLLLEDLDGASFTPPIRADRTTRTDLPGWTQQIQLTAVSLADPSSAAAPEDGAAVLWKLRVTILQDSDVRGTYEWWLIP